jgi:membrane fusion protein, multidrug efflux system
MQQRFEGEAEQELLEEQQRLRDEVQRLRDEQQRMRDEQEKLRAANSQKQSEQQKQPEQKQEPEKKAEPEEKKKKGIKPITIVILLVVIAALAVGGFFLWNYFSSYEATDDAQIDGHINSISSRISGTVTAVYVEDNQSVQAGQLLVDLDPRDYAVELALAKAGLGAAQRQVTAQNPNVPITSTTNQTTISTSGLDVSAALANLAAAEQEHQSALAQVRLAQANHANDLAEVARYKALVDKDEVSRQQYDAKVTTAKASQATVEANQAVADSRKKQIDQAQAQVNKARASEDQARNNAPQQIAIQTAQVATKQAEVVRNQTQVDQAQLNLTYTKIFSPVTGVVGKKTVEVGMRVSPGQELMAIVPLDDIWITANFKETQLKTMKEKQRVTVKVDANGREYEGYVESLAAASGAKYSLLPPENATGNYVKVVQRIPVRIRLKPGQNDDHRLRPGMSVEPKVWLQ